MLADFDKPPVLADILIDDGAISAIVAPGTPTDVDRAVIDVRDCAVIPGLVNAHTHGHGGLSKGSGDRWTLELLLNANSWIGANRSEEDRYISTQIAAVEMLLKGVTTCFDLSLCAPFPTVSGVQASARAYIDAGMRAVVTPMIGDIAFYRAFPGLFEAMPEAERREAQRIGDGDGLAMVAIFAEIARTWPFSSDRARFGLSPTIPLLSTRPFLEGCRDVAREHGLRLQTHLAESRAQTVASRNRFGKSIVAYLDSLGMIDERFSGAHGVWLDEEDAMILGGHGASVSHNPGANLRLGSGISDARMLIAHGVNMAIGTDGGASADSQSVFEATRLACNLSRVHGRSPDRWISAPEGLRLATEGGARLTGFDRLIGRIAPGYRADLVCLDLKHINYTPLNELINHIVHVEDGGAVKRVLVDGEMVVENGRPTRVDYDALRERAAATATRLRAANREQKELAERLAPHISRFCLGLACSPWTHGRPANASGRWLAEPAAES